MFGHDTLFLYFTRRAQQEQVAAVNAASPAAATAHRTLSSLHAAKALLAVVKEERQDEVATGERNPARVAVAA